jgi:hypothetical protein
VLLSALNPKNLVLIIGGATVITQFDLSTGDEALAWIVFMLIASIGVAIPMVIYLVGRQGGGHPRRSQEVDGPQQHRHFGCSAADHRRQADRGFDYRARRLTWSPHRAWSVIIWVTDADGDSWRLV